MALPKEPRQKMINMMYLVLTAMLALNVSAEVLNAFKTVDKAINNSNQVISEKNDLTYQSFADKLADPQTAAKAKDWAPKADKAKTLTQELFDYIESIKLELKTGSHLKILEDGTEQYKESDLNTPTSIMENQGRGEEIYNKLAQYKTDMLSIFDPNEFKDNPSFNDQYIKDIEQMTKSFPVDLTVPASKSANNYSNDAKGWTSTYFKMTPTVAAVTILSKIQNDLRNAEAMVVDYCHQQVGAVKVVYDEFQVIAQPSTTYALQGDEIEITAGIGAFSKSALPDIVINGAKQELNANGTANYKFKAGTPGEHKVIVNVTYTKPDGTKVTVPKEVKYTVGIPSGASVFLEKMNVLYIGVDNPLTVSGGSTGSEKVSVSFDNGTITKESGDRYIAKPTKQGLSSIKVTANGKTYSFPMRVKTLPDPAVFIGGKKGGDMPAAEFKAMGGVVARLEDSDFEAPFRVVSYKVGVQGGPVQMYAEAQNQGNRWNGNAANLISRTGPGSKVFVEEIVVVGPDGRNRTLPGIVFSLK